MDALNKEIAEAKKKGAPRWYVVIGITADGQVHAAHCTVYGKPFTTSAARSMMEKQVMVTGGPVEGLAVKLIEGASEVLSRALYDSIPGGKMSDEQNHDLATRLGAVDVRALNKGGN
jgi:hypothetical protein